MKISIVGAGNAGCFTALYYSSKDVEVELIHNPDISQVAVGQGTIPGPLQLLRSTTRFNWHNNTVHATPKTGFLYEGWGKINYEVFSPFPAENMAMHFCPYEMQNYILNSGRFKVTEGDVDPKDVDADYVIDARGGKPDDRIKLTSPVNSAILGKPKWNTLENLYTEGVATPNGWTFVIPMDPSSPSIDGAVGYLYNNEITKTIDAEKNFREFFDVEVSYHLGFESYYAREPVVDDRIFLQGNRLCFLEPLEATAVATYLYWAETILYAIMNGTIQDLSKEIAIRAEGIVKKYNNGYVGLNKCSYEIQSGSLVAIMGPSGCGKTTLLKTLRKSSSFCLFFLFLPSYLFWQLLQDPSEAENSLTTLAQFWSCLFL